MTSGSREYRNPSITNGLTLKDGFVATSDEEGPFDLDVFQLRRLYLNCRVPKEQPFGMTTGSPNVILKPQAAPFPIASFARCIQH